VRIVAGLAKGRRLAAPARGTRPTSEQAREGLFNTLASSVRMEDARVLDLYAGTGAVGLEALSRGAAEAVLVESRRAALEVLERNVEAVGLPGAQIVRRSVNEFLGTGSDSGFDVIFVDPPYELDNIELAGILASIVLGGWLAPDGSLVVERSFRTGSPPWPETYVTPVRERRYGDAVLWYGRPR
jgi:16S rRNA (guanine966-N2)-methyltransferase